MKIFNVCMFLATAMLIASPSSANSNNDPAQQAVLVTGASSGIGLLVTEYLADHGFYVYAGARKAADLERLDAMDNVSSVRLDVTKQDEIDAARAFVAEQGRGLFGVVNNAGVAAIAPMSTIADEDIQWMHDINVMGPVRINKAFLEMLKQSKGRTVIIGSISGFATSAAGGAYSMSKFAVEAYTEALAEDLEASGVTVGIVDPGGFKSKIREKVAMRRITGSDNLDQKVSAEQQAEIQQMREANARLKEPDEVAEAVMHFLGSDAPRMRYMVPPTESSAHRAIRITLGRVVQLNTGHPYELSRDELVAVLDEILAEQEQGPAAAD